MNTVASRILILAVGLTSACARLIAAPNDKAQSHDISTGDWSVGTGFGFKENVLASEFFPEDSAFAYLSLEGASQRDFAVSGSQWTSAFLLDHRNYLEGDLPNEILGLALTEYSNYVRVDGKITAGLQFLYFDQAFDSTFDILDEQVFVLKAREPKLYVDWEAFFWEFEYRASAGLSRMSFENLSNDYDQIDWEFGIDYMLVPGARLLAEINGFERDYSDRFGRDAEGFQLDGVLLSTDQLGLTGGVEWTSELSGGGDSRFEVLIEQEYRRDKQFGYYDRDRIKYGVRWRIREEKWDVTSELYFADTDYLLQLVGDNEARSSEELIWTIEYERKLSDSWRFFAQASHDESDSNETFFSYDTNSVLLGARFSR